MDLLLAGPGTGKTFKIKQILRDEQPENVLVLSFTNATINDLLDSFREDDFGVDERNCMTLHRYSLILNHLDDFQVLDYDEEKIVEKLAQSTSVPIDFLHTTLRCMTFQKMITDCTAYITANPRYAEEKIGNLELLIVDEFQDFNEAERKLIYAVSQRAQRTIILGDDDQAIYGFKDADAAELVSLYNTPDVNKLTHENICYRCPDEVVMAASRLINKNKQRVEKDWKTSGKDGFCKFEQFKDQSDTMNQITTTIHELYGEIPETKPSVMILSPSKFITVGLAKFLEDAGIPAKDWTANKLSLDRLADAAYLKFALGAHRLLNLYLFAALANLSPYRKTKLIKLIGSALRDGFDEKALLADVATKNIFDLQVASDINSPPEMPSILARPHFSEYAEFFDDVDDAQKLRVILQRLTVLMRGAVSVEADSDCVNIMSIHRSKGLQADYVFILGLVNGVIPNKNQGLTSYEAQRRQLFVGMTRAKKGLYCISSTEWSGGIVNKFDKTQFRYSPRAKSYLADTSDFIKEILAS